MRQLEIEQAGDVAIAHVVGDIDAANVAATQRQLDYALGPDATSLVIDLREARYVDSAGIDMLLRLSDRLDRRRARLILVIADGSQLKRLAVIVGLPDAVAIEPSVPDAIRAAAGSSTTVPAHRPDGAGQQQSQAQR